MGRPVVAGRGPVLTAAVRTPLLILSAVAAAVLVVLGALVAGTSTAATPDGPVQAAVSAIWPSPGRFAYTVDSLVDPLSVAVLTILLAAVCAVTRRWRAGVGSVVSVIAVGALATLGKPLVGRTIHGDNLSYPSGHAAVATALAAVTALAFLDVAGQGRLRRLLAFVMASAVGAVGMAADQIAIQAHYPTDTLGGACLALAVVPPVAALVDALATVLDRRRRRNARSYTVD